MTGRRSGVQDRRRINVGCRCSRPHRSPCGRQNRTERSDRETESGPARFVEEEHALSVRIL